MVPCYGSLFPLPRVAMENILNFELYKESIFLVSKNYDPYSLHMKIPPYCIINYFVVSLAFILT